MGEKYAKIAKALAICMPETLQESEMECFQCPYCDECKSDHIISLPATLAIEIRKYFSANWDLNTPIQ